MWHRAFRKSCFHMHMLNVQRYRGLSYSPRIYMLNRGARFFDSWNLFIGKSTMVRKNAKNSEYDRKHSKRMQYWCVVDG